MGVNILSGCFRFHPIGQGCFYSGVIKARQASFNMVFDCGTSSHGKFLEEEIDQYAEKTDVIDLIVISHFHQDHISGFLKLLKKNGCRRLVIPYCNPVERLFLLAAGEQFDAEAAALLANPVKFLADGEMTIGELIIIGSPPGDEIGNPALLTNGKILDPYADRLQFTDYFDEASSVKFEASLSEDESISQTSKTIVRFYALPFRFTIGENDWEFVFYYQKGNRYYLQYRFQNEITAMRQQMSDFFKKDGLRLIKKLYREIDADMNNTSLILYHNMAGRRALENNQYVMLNTPSADKDRTGTLLTGDIDLGSAEKVSALKDYFTNYFNHISFFQVPHHGSIENWQVNNPAVHLYQFPYYIFNHRKENKRGYHPNDKVLNDITGHNQGAELHHNTEKQSYNYSFKISDTSQVSDVGGTVLEKQITVGHRGRK